MPFASFDWLIVVKDPTEWFTTNQVNKYFFKTRILFIYWGPGEVMQHRNQNEICRKKQKKKKRKRKDKS